VVRIKTAGPTEVVRITDGTSNMDGANYKDEGRAVEAFLLDSVPSELKA
jgi:hypothetical protein